jgi:hypothetical protein
VKLSQSRGLLRIDSEILSDGVFYRERGLLSSNETKIPFEQIAGELVRTFHVPRLYLFISVFFALALGYRLVRFVSTDTVSLPSLLWSGVLFLVPAFGTWMQSPRYVGYLTSRGGLLFFDKTGAQDPSGYLEEIQQARERYFHAQDRRRLNVQSGDESASHRSSVH